MGRKEPSRRCVELRHRRLRGFSDCFSNHSGENKCNMKGWSPKRLDPAL